MFNFLNPFLKAPNKGDNTSEAAATKVEEAPRKIEVKFLDEKPEEKEIASNQDVPAVASQSIEQKDVHESNPYIEMALVELKSALDQKNVSDEKKKEYVDKFLNKVKDEQDNHSIDMMMGEVLVELIHELELKNGADGANETPIDGAEVVSDETKKKAEIDNESSTEDKAKEDAAPVLAQEEAEKKVEAIISIKELNTQKKLFAEKFKESIGLIVHDDIRRGDIIENVGFLLGLITIENIKNLNLKSSKAIDVWGAIFDEIAKGAGPELNSALRENILDAVRPSDIEEEKKVTEPEKDSAHLELSRKLSLAINDGESFYETLEDKIEEIFSKTEFAKDTEKAAMISWKLKALMSTWNDFIVRFEDKKERSQTLLDDFLKLRENAGKLLEEVSAWKAVETVSDKKLKKSEMSTTEFEKLIERIEGIKNVTIEKIKNSKRTINKISIDDLKVKDLSDEQNRTLTECVDAANSSIANTKAEKIAAEKAAKIAQKKKNVEKNEKSKLEKVAEKENVETSVEHENDAWSMELQKAIENIKILTVEQFDAQYHASQIVYADSDYNAHEVLSNFLHSHNNSVDKVHNKETEAFAKILEAAKHINNEIDLFDIIIVNGHTYKVRKNLSAADIEKSESESIIENINEDFVNISENKNEVGEIGEKKEDVTAQELKETEIVKLPEGIVDVFKKYAEIEKNKAEAIFPVEMTEAEKLPLLNELLRRLLSERIVEKSEVLLNSYAFDEKDGKIFIDKIVEEILNKK